MSSFTTPARVRFPRSNVTGKAPDTLAPGSLAINWEDRKIFVGDAGGKPIRIAQYLRDWSVARAYRRDDFVLFELRIYRALRDLAAGTAFSTSDWELIADSARARVSEPYATSILSGGVVTFSGAVVSVTAGTGIVVDASDPNNVVSTEVSWSAFSVNLSAETERWLTLGIDVTGTVAIGSANFTDPDFVGAEWRRDHILLAQVLFDVPNDTVESVHDASIPVAGTAETLRDMYHAYGGAHRITGVRIKPGPTNLQLALTSGAVFDLGVAWRTTPKSPNTVPVNGQEPVNLYYVSSAGAEDPSTLSLRPTLWDNAGTLETVPDGNATIQYAVLAPNGRVYIHYGRQLYANLTTALDNLANDWETYVQPEFGAPTLMLAALVMTKEAVSVDTDVFITQANPVGDPFSGGAAGAGDTSQFLLVDGSRPMVAPFNAGGFAIENAIVDGGSF